MGIDTDADGPLSWMDFSYEIDRPQPLALFRKSKRLPWDPDELADDIARLPKNNPLGMAMRTMPVVMSDWFCSMAPDERDDMRRRFQHWLVSQFLHIEQLGLLVCTRLAQRLPVMIDKMYAVAQASDEARHIEAYRMVLNVYGKAEPLSVSIGAVYNQVLTESDWDFMLLGNQILVEGLGLSIFGQIRDASSEPVVKKLHQYICDDEARHFAFGRYALMDVYKELTDTEILHREEFILEGLEVLKKRVSGVEFWAAAGMPKAECDAILASPAARLHRMRVFSKVIPALSDLGLWSERLAARAAKIDVVAGRSVKPTSFR